MSVSSYIRHLLPQIGLHLLKVRAAGGGWRRLRKKLLRCTEGLSHAGHRRRPPFDQDIVASNHGNLRILAKIGEDRREIDDGAPCCLHLRPDGVVQASKAKRIVAAGLNKLSQRVAADLFVFFNLAWLAIRAKEKALAESIIVIGIQMEGERPKSPGGVRSCCT